VRAGGVAVGRIRKPACDQAQCYRALTWRERIALGRVFEIEQAEIILAAFAQHDLQLARARIAFELAHFLKDLTLEVPRVGGNPKTGAVLLGPERGRRQIAEGLARTRARFNESDARTAWTLPRRESIRGRGGELLLLAPERAAASDERDQPGL